MWTNWKWSSDTRTRKFRKTDRNRTCSIFIRHSSWKMKGANKFCMIPCDRFGAKLKILCQFWKSYRVNTLQITFGHSHHKNGTLKSARLSAYFQFSERRIGSLKSDRVNGPLNLNFDIFDVKFYNFVQCPTPLSFISYLTEQCQSTGSRVKQFFQRTWFFPARKFYKI